MKLPAVNYQCRKRRRGSIFAPRMRKETKFLGEAKGFISEGKDPERRAGFTLIELLVVITIIGILSGIGLIAFSRAQAQARDGRRRADLKILQQAVEMYYVDNKSYPPTGGAWWGQCDGFLSKTATCDANTFIPNICPPYIANVPKDPKADAVGSDCYIYRSNSNGTDYMILAYMVVETLNPVPADDPMRRPNYSQPTFAVYSPGGRTW